MDSSPSRIFDANFTLFGLNYLLDGVLTIVALYHGFAREANPAAVGLPLSGILSAKVLGLVSVMGAAYLAVRFHPRIAPKLSVLWRYSAMFFSAVCLNNLLVIWRAIP